MTSLKISKTQKLPPETQKPKFKKKSCKEASNEKKEVKKQTIFRILKY